MRERSIHEQFDWRVCSKRNYYERRYLRGYEGTKLLRVKKITTKVFWISGSCGHPGDTTTTTTTVWED